ncbi:flagellar assembly protein FliH [Celerinatantimonas sp. MCCC 1A17872]|uniref:flagellar assembly protein FliH n=1 Tax=Celerinatantimonas sp. MCCC 1A17872 TaxID=3177514 RepID=UPI0038C29792
MADHIKDEDIAKFRHVEAQDYELPNFGNAPHHEDTDAFDRPYHWYKEEAEQARSDNDEEPIKPLTLEDLEQIRQTAYEEGHAEGRSAGYEQGFAQGHEEGAKAGKTEGLQQGLKEGLEQGHSQIDTLSGYWQKLIEELVMPVQQVTAQVQLQLVDVICEVSKAIIQTELTTNKQVIIHTVKEAVQAMPVNEQTLLIHLHPDDLLVIEGVFPKETQEKKHWQLLADGSLNRGDCMIEAQNSTIDYSMSDVVDRALKRFLSDNIKTARTVEPPEVPDVEPLAQAHESSESENSASDLNESAPDLTQPSENQSDESQTPLPESRQDLSDDENHDEHFGGEDDESLPNT